ncbi:MAG: hypothetical protein RLZZ384_604 [Pseudomonadota bacterium]
MNDNVIENGLEFKLSKSGRKLLAVFMPSEDKLNNLTVEMINRRLEKAGFSHLFVSEFGVGELLSRYNNATAEAFECEIGEQRDAKCEIVVSDDKLIARMTITPNFGGTELTMGAIQKAIKDKEIKWGIIPIEKIEALLAKGACTDVIIAEGLRPVDGIDAQFKSMMPNSQSDRKPKIDENGMADYRELGDIPVVYKDAVVMQRTPPIEGKKGCDIFGEVILPKVGADTPFSKDMTGVYVNPEDENQLLSSVTGQPVAVPNGMTVSPILTLKKVDFSTGNIRFDGAVVIKGDVTEGMNVYALEDVVIDGSVINASVKSMGSLNIKGGVTGNSELFANADINIKNGAQGAQDQTEEEKATNTGKIVARNSVIIGFAENFHIEAGGDIVISKYAMNSQLIAGNKIFAGAKNGSKKSSIMGGSSCALMQIKAVIIGSLSGIKTHLQVGLNPYIQKQVANMKNDLIAKQSEQNDINKILAFLDDHPEKSNEATMAKLHRTMSKLTIDIKASKEELQELMDSFSVIDNARVVVDRGVFIGTEVQIGNTLWKAYENRGKSTFTLVKVGTPEIYVT